MLFLPNSAYQELDRLVQEGGSGRMDPRTAGERMVTMCPQCLAAYVLLHKACTDAGDAAGAQQWLWLAIEQIPAASWPYFLLAVNRRQRDPDDLLARRLLEM